MPVHLFLRPGNRVTGLGDFSPIGRLIFWWDQQLLVPLLLIGPPFFPIILFGPTTLSTGMTGVTLHMQWPLTSQSNANVSQSGP
jgi:hypothetical protein